MLLKVLLVVLVSAVAGFLLPLQFDNRYRDISDFYNIQLFDFIFSVPSALLVWCVFHLIQPSRHGRKWTIAEFIVVPIIWLSLMLAFDSWVHYMFQPREFMGTL